MRRHPRWSCRTVSATATSRQPPPLTVAPGPPYGSAVIVVRFRDGSCTGRSPVASGRHGGDAFPRHRRILARVVVSLAMLAAGVMPVAPSAADADGFTSRAQTLL